MTVWVKNSIVWGIGLLSLGLLMTLSLLEGNESLDLSVFWSSISDFDDNNIHHLIIWKIRFPRVFAAILVGAALAVSGYLIQMVVNNPLADPYLLGAASGASLGANLSVFGVFPIMVFGLSFVSIWAFLCSLGVTVSVIFVAQRRFRIQTFHLILAGVGVTSLITSVTSCLIYFSDSDEKLRSIIFWAMGSLERATWSSIPGLGTVTVVVVVAVWFSHKQLNMMMLGQERAKALGMKVQRYQWFLLVAATLLTAYAVAVVGPIGFIGLIVPHFTRALFGVINRQNVIFASLFGGVFLLTCDLFGRMLYPPVGIPAGIISSFAGIPLFLYLLVRSGYSFK